MPSLTCGVAPSCTTPGMVVPLAGTCNATGNASVVYLVNGVPSTQVTCPQANTTVTVAVQPQYPTLPQCPYNATTGFNITSENVLGCAPAAPTSLQASCLSCMC